MGLQFKIDHGGAAAYKIPQFLGDGLRIEITDDICTLALCKGNEKYCLLDSKTVTSVLKSCVFWALNLVFFPFQLQILFILSVSLLFVGTFKFMMDLNLFDPISKLLLILSELFIHLIYPLQLLLILNQVEGNPFANLLYLKLLQVSLLLTVFAVNVFLAN